MPKKKCCSDCKRVLESVIDEYSCAICGVNLCYKCECDLPEDLVKEGKSSACSPCFQRLTRQAR
jgi:hypothetical protein